MGEYIVVAFMNGGVWAWDGRYGWRLVPPERPEAINVLNRYKTAHAAKQAIRRMRDRRNREASKVILHADVWVNNELNWELLRSREGKKREERQNVLSQ